MPSETSLICDFNYKILFKHAVCGLFSFILLVAFNLFAIIMPYLCVCLKNNYGGNQCVLAGEIELNKKGADQSPPPWRFLNLTCIRQLATGVLTGGNGQVSVAARIDDQGTQIPSWVVKAGVV